MMLVISGTCLMTTKAAAAAAAAGVAMKVRAVVE
jgi:hypothetical protein